MAKLFESKSDAGLYTEDLRMTELEQINFDDVIFSNEHYEVRPTIMVTGSGEPFSAYGVFNKNTGVMEADSRQYPAAVQWAKALEKLTNRLPQLDEELDMMDAAMNSLPVSIQ